MNERLTSCAALGAILLGCGTVGAARDLDADAPKAGGAPRRAAAPASERSATPDEASLKGPVLLSVDDLEASPRGFIDAAEALVESSPTGDRKSRHFEIRDKIVRGARECGWTSVGAVLRDNSMHCTGTLISRRTVLTAAHCIGDAEGAPERFTFFVGCERGTPGDTFQVGRAWSHRGHVRRRAAHDVGILCLGKDPGIAAMVLPGEVLPDSEYRDRSLTFVGFGLYDPRERQSFGVRRQAAMRVRDVGTFSFSYGGPDRNTCNIDSGGPAFRGNMVLGVTSYGDRPCMEYGVNARVDRNLEFIHEAMAACETSP